MTSKKDDYLPLERLWAYLTIKQLLDKRDAGEDGPDDDTSANESPKQKALAIALKVGSAVSLKVYHRRIFARSAAFCGHNMSQVQLTYRIILKKKEHAACKIHTSVWVQWSIAHFFGLIEKKKKPG